MNKAFNWKSLQNGSDIRGVATDGVAGEPVTLTAEVMENIAGAFISWLSERTGFKAEELSVSVGRDSRISGPELMIAFIRGVNGHGANAVNCGLASTPALFMSTVFDNTRCDGAVMLTASHLPFNRNGVKFFMKEGGLDKQDISDILERAAAGEARQRSSAGYESFFDLIAEYSHFLVDTIRKGVNHPAHYETPLLGFHIVVDAGNGAGGFFADQVLQPLGALTRGSQFLEPDGTFPNHVPNPEDETAMQSIRKAVVENQADMGIIFDTDVDRAAAVDHTGAGINRNNLIALVAAIVLEEHPGSVIVTDSITSDGLAAFISQNLKGIHHRYKRGYKNVINESVRLNQEGKESWLAIETSGHAALKENYFLDDGAFLMTKILIKAAKLRLAGERFHHLINDLSVPAESRELRIKIGDPDFKSFGNKVIGDLLLFADCTDGWTVVPDNYEGVRVSCSPDHGDGWFLLRLSLHDPVMPLNIESNRTGGVDQIINRLDAFFAMYPELDFTRT